MSGNDQYNHVSPPLATLIVALLWARETERDDAVRRLCDIWGKTEMCSPDFAFTATDYYEQEMGPGLQRRLLAFEKLVDPGQLAEFKHATNRIEHELARNGRRTVNLDIGTLDLHRIVLASVKDGRQKIYLQNGIWGDLVLLFEKGKFCPLPWTFPDFRSGIYDEFLAQIRTQHRTKIRERRRC